MKLAFPVAALAFCVAFANVAMSAPPVLDAGTCTYLVGAPPGGSPAVSEDRFEGTRVDDDCFAIVNVATRTYEPNGAQLHVVDTTVNPPSCRAVAWVGHAFTVAPTSAAHRARIDMTGGIDGIIHMPPALLAHVLGLRLWVELSVAEIDPLTGESEVLTRREVLSRAVLLGRLEVRESFGESLSVNVVPGRTYAVRLALWAYEEAKPFTIDFGPPGAGRGAWYDSIEVCLEEPPEDSGLTTRLDALDEANLELRLYNKECLPGVWLPVAQGGRLEDARQLLADRIAQATASGDPNVNGRVATMRLAAADASIAAGQYQRACRDLSDGLRALTTP